MEFEELNSFNLFDTTSNLSLWNEIIRNFNVWIDFDISSNVSFDWWNEAIFYLIENFHLGYIVKQEKNLKFNF